LKRETKGAFVCIQNKKEKLFSLIKGAFVCIQNKKEKLFSLIKGAFVCIQNSKVNNVLNVIIIQKAITKSNVGQHMQK
jgi:hypothetical protein